MNFQNSDDMVSDFHDILPINSKYQVGVWKISANSVANSLYEEVSVFCTAIPNVIFWVACIALTVYPDKLKLSSFLFAACQPFILDTSLDTFA